MTTIGARAPNVSVMKPGSRQSAVLTWNGTVELPDGRRLAFTSMGTPSGYPILYFHGAIGTSPLAAAEFRDALARTDVRIVMVHRPGFGGSSRCAGRTVTSFVADVGVLRRRLGFGRFSLVAVSAGAPYALACAARFGPELHKVALVGTIPPPGRYWTRLRALAGVFDGPIADDFRAHAEGWDFELGSIAGPVSVWHGTLDPIAPLRYARSLAETMPAARLIALPGEGHFFFRRRVEEILEPLLPSAPAEGTLYAASA